MLQFIFASGGIARQGHSETETSEENHCMPYYNSQCPTSGNKYDYTINKKCFEHFLKATLAEIVDPRECNQ